MLSIRCFELANECMYLQSDGPSEPHIFHIPRSIARCLRVPTLDAFVRSYDLQMVPIDLPTPGPKSSSDAGPAYLGPLHVPMAGSGAAHEYQSVPVSRSSPNPSVSYRAPRPFRHRGPVSAQPCASESHHSCTTHPQGLQGSSAVPGPSRLRPYLIYGQPAGYENWEASEEVVSYSETRSLVEGPSVDDFISPTPEPDYEEDDDEKYNVSILDSSDKAWL